MFEWDEEKPLLASRLSLPMTETRHVKVNLGCASVRVVVGLLSSFLCLPPSVRASTPAFTAAGIKPLL